MSKLTFARNASGEFEFSESKLAKFNAALIKRTSHPQLPVSVMDAASREAIGEVSRMAAALRIEYLQAARLWVRERPQLYTLTRYVTVPDGAGDVEVSE